MSQCCNKMCWVWPFDIAAVTTMLLYTCCYCWGVGVDQILLFYVNFWTNPTSLWYQKERLHIKTTKTTMIIIIGDLDPWVQQSLWRRDDVEHAVCWRCQRKRRRRSLPGQSSWIRIMFEVIKLVLGLLAIRLKVMLSRPMFQGDSGGPLVACGRDGNCGTTTGNSYELIGGLSLSSWSCSSLSSNLISKVIFLGWPS